MKKAKFTIKDFNDRYPDDDACLQEVFEMRYGDSDVCPKCGKPFRYHKLTDVKAYSCQYCGHHLHPLADTIFHKSSTPLKSWFYAIYLFSVSKNGVAAKELERQLGVTYKCAWRIAKLVRTLFSEYDAEPLENTVEIDETYVGGKHKGKRGRGSENKTPIIGAVERNGEVRARVVGDTSSSTVKPFVRENISIEAEIMTDEFRSYSYLERAGYKHETVNHGRKEYVRGNTHTNTIEGFWSQLKTSIAGTYHFVSRKHLQTYLDEFVYRYNCRHDVMPLFYGLVGRVLLPF